MEEEKPKAMEVQDRGLFDFVGKKEDDKDEGCHEEVLVTGVEKIHIEEEEEKKKEGLLEKLHRTHSSSSSSSSDEEEVDGDKKKKKTKKGLKEKIKEKLGGEKKEGEQVVVSEGEVVAGCVATGDGDDTTVLVEKVEDTIAVEPATPEEEKKGLLDKIKEKLPGHKKPAEEATAAPPTAPAVASPTAEGEKKGLLGKIMEKLPGYHKGDEKEGDK